jgi:NADPH:quinone reductase-like Zn-dependent oxidoreductase
MNCEANAKPDSGWQKGDNMKSIEVQQYGGEEQLKMVDVRKPEPGPRQVLVRIAATSFNPIDPKRVSGVMRQVFPLQFPFTPGGDFSGVVEAVGSEVESFRPGDEVFGYSMSGGAYAEVIAIDADKVALKPKTIGDVEAASLALVAQTALQMLDRVAARRGQTILIHGAGGAVGSVAVQVAHKRGLTVIATSSAASLNRVKADGADLAIDYAATPFEEVAKNVDAVLDTVGGPVQQRSYGVLKPGGSLVAITQPPSPEEAAKHNVTASMLITEVSTASLQKVAAMIDAGEIMPHVGSVRPLTAVAEAWRETRSGHLNGKIVFTL